ncbi:hypothetical protein [Pseudoxanthomonas wuyuanensis]
MNSPGAGHQPTGFHLPCANTAPAVRIAHCSKAFSHPLVELPNPRTQNAAMKLLAILSSDAFFCGQNGSANFFLVEMRA